MLFKNFRSNLVDQGHFETRLQILGGDVLVKAFSKSGTKVGQATFTTNDNGKTYYSDDTWVDPNYRRSGIATAMYDHVKKKGYKIVKSKTLTPDGEKFTKKYFTLP